MKILLQQKKHFIIRCKRSFFKAVDAFFNGEYTDKILNINVPVDQQKVIKKLYGLRWEIETFFGVLKGRLSLENFTGLTVEAIKQDFWSTIFISN